jgi:hypothetical protein
VTTDPYSAARSDRAQPECSRRELLEALALACGLALAGGIALPACSAPDPLEGALRGFYRDRQAARAVGAEVLALAPERAGSEELVARVARNRAPALRELAASNPPQLFEALRAQHREDFAQGRVAVVRGWVLSETESALLALAADPLTH